MTWEVLDQHVLYDASPWLTLIQEHVRLPNGQEIPDYYRVNMASYVVIVAVDQQDRIALVEHYKHGPGVVSLEPPAGYIEPGDDPLQTAQRELREETGLASENWLPLGRYFIDGNRGCGWMYGFLAREAYHAGDPQHEETEIMTVRMMPVAEVYGLWLAGRFTNASALGLVGYALAQLGCLGTKDE